jgi:hypothetical protein
VKKELKLEVDWKLKKLQQSNEIKINLDDNNVEQENSEENEMTYKILEKINTTNWWINI